MKSIQDIFDEACHYGYLNIVKICIENGADIHNYSNWALRESVTYNHYELVKFLLENGADPSSRYPGGWDSFMIAIFLKNNNILELLNQYRR